MTWEQVRAYLKAEGWGPLRRVDGCEWWARGSDGVWVATRGVTMASVVRSLAALTSMSPGEMLTRIADGAEPSAADDLRLLGVSSEEVRDDGTARRIDPSKVRIRGLDAKSQAAAEDMRERCAEAAIRYARPVGPSISVESAEGIAAAIRALPLTPAEPSPPPAETGWTIAYCAGRQCVEEHQDGRLRIVDRPAPLCVPGCARRETEGAGHPGACREAAVVPANDDGKAKV